MGNNRNRWTAPQLALLEAMQKAGAEWPAIAIATGHPVCSCRQKLSQIRSRRRDDDFRQERNAIDEAKAAKFYHRWSTDDINLLLQLKAQRKPMLCNAEIADNFGVSIKAIIQMVHRLRKDGIRLGTDLITPGEPVFVRAKKDDLGPLKVTVADPPFNRPSASSWKLRTDAELRARIHLVGITAGLLGDPLPGRSALDRRNAACGGVSSGGRS